MFRQRFQSTDKWTSVKAPFPFPFPTNHPIHLECRHFIRIICQIEWIYRMPDQHLVKFMCRIFKTDNVVCWLLTVRCENDKKGKKLFNRRVAFDHELFVRKTTDWYTDNAHIQNVFVYAGTRITYRIMSTKCRQTILWKIENGTLFFIHAQVAMFINHVRYTITQFHLSFISQKITNRMNTCPISHALNSNQAMHIYMLTIHYCERSQRWK